MASVIDYVTKFIQLLRFSDFVDIVVVAGIILNLINWMQETRAMQLVKGLVILFALLLVSDWANLTVLNYILNTTVQVGIFALVVIFQPELRSLLEKMGRSKVGKLMDLATANGMAEDANSIIYDEIVTAVMNMSASKTGALIVIERDTKLGEHIRTGTRLDANVSAAILENIFVPNTPLHDGAVIIRGNKIVSAGCVLPITSNNNLSRELGTRHRAALGISEASDAVIVIVSEETGKVSIAINGSLTRNLSREPLRKALSKSMMKRTADKEPFDKIKFWKAGTERNVRK